MDDHSDQLSGPGRASAAPPDVLPLVAFVATALAFLPALGGGFIDWDDGSLLLRNPWYRGLGLANLAWMFSTVRMGHWMPLNWLSFGLDYVIWGMNPLGYHLTNVALHAAAAAVLYVVAKRVLRVALSDCRATNGWLRAGALVAALAFGFHPLRVESVAWITERRDVLSGLFYLLTISTYLRYVERRSRGAYWASVGCFALALMSKSITASLPAVLLLLDVYPLGRLGGHAGWLTREALRVWREKLPFVALAGAAAVVAFWALAQGSGLTPLRTLGFGARAALSLYALAFYLGKTLWPAHLSPLYELVLPVRPLEARFALGALGVVAVTATALLFRRRWPALLAAWLAFALTLLPVLGVAHNGYQLAADRYTYLASLGLALLLGGLVTRWGRPALVAALLGLTALVALSWMQIPAWQSDLTLWRHAVALDAASGVARSNLGAALTADRRYEDATRELEQAVALRPGYAEAWNNLGLALAPQAGRLPEAADAFRRALAVRPRFGEAWNNLGVALATQGETERALVAFAQATVTDPSSAEARNNLGLALAGQGRVREAAVEFQRALALNPDFLQARRNLDQAERLLR
ncbi:MAG TPA: tetratricopeptide repeat protein [Methylomirabilota bacterium]|nr:tetratricopeptide repeat protein [Methylomirabilota bacterium]